MKLYIYDVETNAVVEQVEGATNHECEKKAEDYLGCDEYAGTQSPAFGAVDGLIAKS